MSVIVHPRIQCKRPIVAKKSLRRIGDGVFRTIVEMAYEMGTCEWRDNVKGCLLPLFRSVKAYADKPKRLNGKLPPLRREKGWVRHIETLVYPEKLDSHTIAKHLYLYLTPSGIRNFLDVRVCRHFVDDEKEDVQYNLSITLFRKEWLNDGTYVKRIYTDYALLDDMDEVLNRLPKKNLITVKPKWDDDE